MNRMESHRSGLAGEGLPEAGPLDRLLCVFSLAVVFCSAFHSLIDPDIWFHLRSGAEIVAGGFLHTDTISYPSQGNPYVDLHWLFQILALGVFRLGGEAGLVLMVTALALAAFGLLFLLARRHMPPGPAALLTALGAVVASERFTARPEMLTFVYLALTLWLAARHREGDRKAAWILPGVFLLWVNTEGLFVLGYAVLAASLVDSPRDRRLWISSLACLLVSLVNPYGLEGALHPLVLFTRINQSLPIYSATIGEFLGPFADEPLHPSVILFPYYLGLTGAALLFSLSARCRPKLGEILLIGVFVYLSLSARRNIALLPLAATPIVARWIGGGAARSWPAAWWRGLSPRGRSLIRGAAAGLACAILLAHTLGLVTDRTYARAETNRGFGLGPAPVAYPADAVRLLRAEDPPGPVFSTFAAGSYMTWAYPEKRVFIDGRLEVHTPEHYERFLRILRDPRAWQQADAEFRFGSMVLAYMDNISFAMDRLRDREWAPIHFDDTALVLVRRTPANEERIARLAVTIEGLYNQYPAVDRGWIESEFTLPRPASRFSPARLFRRQPFPWEPVNLGQFFLALGRRDLALAQFLIAVGEAPDLPEPRLRAATTLNQMGYPAQAERTLASAEGLGGSESTRTRMHVVRGDILAATGRPAQAVQSYTRYLENPPARGMQVPSVLASRGQARLQAGDPLGAQQDLVQALRTDPGLLQGYLALGRAEEALGRPAEAVRAYERFVQLGGPAQEVEEALRRLGRGRSPAGPGAQGQGEPPQAPGGQGRDIPPQAPEGPDL